MATEADDKKTQKLSIFLIKSDVKTFREALKPKISISEFPLRPDFPHEGVIYLGSTKKKDPKWKEFLQRGTSDPLPGLKNSSNRALLFLKIQKRIFVIVFGYGKHLINDEAIERDFGIRTVLNIVNPDKLRSLDRASLDQLTMLTRSQTSRQAAQQAFNIDPLKDLLRGVTGEPSEVTMGHIITGNEGIYINPQIDFDDLPKKLTHLKTAYGETKYKQHFSWVDNLREEKDATRLIELGEMLVKALVAKDNINVQLAAPYLIDWSDFEGFTYSKEGELQEDLSIENFYQLKEDSLKDLTWEKLMRFRLFIKEGSHEEMATFSLWRCLNFQTIIGDYVFVYIFGKWYRVDKKFADRIRSEVDSIEESTTVFIPCKKKMDEGKYNEAQANSNSKLTLMDKVLASSDYPLSGIEACDLISKTGEFVHVKFRKSSATMSHLFAQGKISALALRNDRTFRENLREKIAEKGLNKNLIPLESNKLSPSKYTITFALIDDKDRSFVDSLPFFSLLNFKLTASDLLLWGYNVKTKKIIIE